MPRPIPEDARRQASPAPHPRPQFDLFYHADGALALVLWRVVRDVLLWAETEPDRRSRIFRPPTDAVRERYAAATEAAPELAQPLAVFASFQNAPHLAAASALAAVCHAVHMWAERSGLVLIAAHFAEAAAYAEPDNPAWAVDAGWMCRKAGTGDLLDRAEAWYERAFGLAVRARNRKESIRALTGYGALLKDQGRVDEARKAYERAARRATRTGRHRQAAVSYHYLFALAAESGGLDEAVEHARRALSLYPLHDERIPYLAHDYSVLLVRFGFYRPALRLLDRAVKLFERAEELALVFGTMARAAGGAGRRERYETAERAVLGLVGLSHEYAPGAYINLAEGAWSLGDVDRAVRYARITLDRARERHDAEPERMALLLLDTMGTQDKPRRDDTPAPDARIAALNRRMAARLGRWRRRAGRRRPASY